MGKEEVVGCFLQKKSASRFSLSLSNKEEGDKGFFGTKNARTHLHFSAFPYVRRICAYCCMFHGACVRCHLTGPNSDRLIPTTLDLLGLFFKRV